METLEVDETLKLQLLAPHSLGKLIEWKQPLLDKLQPLSKTPHSLGKLIEWKQLQTTKRGKGCV